MNNPYKTEPVRDYGENWEDRAKCSGADPEAFFPPAPNGAPRRHLLLYVQDVCRGCPVTAQCAATGVGKEGIWGGHFTSRRASAAT